MELKVKVISNQSAVQSKQTRQADNTVTTETKKVSRIVARGEGCQLAFDTDYENGKTFELDKELNIQVE